MVLVQSSFNCFMTVFRKGVFITHCFLPQLYQEMAIVSSVMLFSAKIILLGVRSPFALFLCKWELSSSHELVPSVFKYW